MERFAKIISDTATSFFWVLPWLVILSLIFFMKYTTTPADTKGMVFLALWTFIVGIFLKRKLNLDSPNRKYRTIFLLIIVLGWIIFSIFYWNNFSWFFQDALIIAFSIIFVLFINNIFYRISFHVSLTTSLLILVNHFNSWKLWPVFIIIPLIAWSRVHLNKHTVFQVIAGFLFPLLVYGLLKYLQLLT